ncbi:MAG: hypothetical protein RIB60_00890 [Phycisphaerales bacterium]
MNPRLVIAGIVAIAGVSVLAWVVLTGRARPAPDRAVEIEDVIDEATIDRASEHDRERTQRVVDSILETVTSAGSPQSEVVTVAQETISAYLNPDVSVVLDLLRRQGIEPPRSLANGDEEAQERWRRKQALLALAEFDAGSAVWREGPPPPASSGFRRMARRDAGRAFLGDIPESARRSAELAIAAEFTAQDGEVFPGELGFGFVLNPENGQWVLCHLRIDGVPNGVLAMLPPL